MAIINGTFLPDILLGTSDDDTINGFGGLDTLSGGDGHDTIDGGAGDDVLIGGDGNDILIGGTGAATLLSQYNGGVGNDLMIASSLGVAEDFDGGDDIDTVSFAARNSGVTVFLSVVGIPLLDTIRNTENIIGSAYDDELTGDGADNELTGGAGDDVLDGSGGSDTAVFSGNRDDYAASRGSGNTIIIADQRGGAPDGEDTVNGVEFFKFADGTFTAAQLFAPTLSGVAASVTFAENTVNATVQVIDANVSLSVIESLDAGTLTVTGLIAEDIVSIQNVGNGAGEIGFSAGDVRYGGVIIGTATGGTGGTLTITFNANATAAAAEALIEHLTYRNNSDTPTAAHNLTITVTDGSAGTSSSIVTINVTAENDAPTITFDSVNFTDSGASDGITNNNVVVFSGTVSDADGTISQVEVFNGATSLGLANVNAGTWSLTATLADGPYNQFNATAKDDIGATTNATHAATFTIDTTAPVAANDAAAVAENATVSGDVIVGAAGGAGHDTGATTVTGISGAGGTGTVGQGLIGALGTLTLNPNGSYSYTADRAEALAAGVTATDTFTYTVADSVGNTATANLVITVTAENDAPTITFGSVNFTDSGASDGITNNNVVVFSGTVSDADGTISQVEVFNGATSLGLANVNAGTWSLTATLADGPYNQFNATAKDDIGATTNATHAATFTIDTTAPVAANDAAAVAENATVSGDVIVGAAGGAGHDTGATTVTGISGAGGTGTVGQGLIGALGTLTLNPNGSYSYTADRAEALAAGVTATDTFTYTVADSVGNTATANLVITVTGVYDAPANNPPVITSHGGVNDTIVSVDENSIAVTTVTATDLDGTALTFSLSGEDSAFFQIDSSGALSFRDPQDFEAPADYETGNTYQVTVRVSDGIDFDLQSFVVYLQDVDDTTGTRDNPWDMFDRRGFGGRGFDDFPWWSRPTTGGVNGVPTKSFPWADRENHGVQDRGLIAGNDLPGDDAFHTGHIEKGWWLS